MSPMTLRLARPTPFPYTTLFRSELYGELAAAQPDAFRPALASSLNNLAYRLSDLGRREEAWARAQEAVELYGELAAARSEEHTSELQSRQYLVCRLLLEKKITKVIAIIVTVAVIAWMELSRGHPGRPAPPADRRPATRPGAHPAPLVEPSLDTGAELDGS